MNRFLNSIEKASFPRLLLIIFLSSLIPRLFVLIFLNDGCFLTNSICPPIADQGEYILLAKNVIIGKGFMLDVGYSQLGKPYTYRTPGYSGFLIIAMSLSAGNLIFVRLIQMFLSTLIPISIFFLGKIFFPLRWAFLLALLCSFSPFFIYYSFFFLADFLYQLCFIIGFAILVIGIKSQFHPYKNLLFVTAGLLMASACLARSEALYFNFIILFFLCIYFFVKKITYKSIMIYSITLFLPLSFWMFRNYAHHGSFQLQSKIIGINLYSSYHPQTTGVAWPEYEDWIKKTKIKTKNLNNDQEIDNLIIKEAIKFFSQYPTKLLQVTILKGIQIWKVFPQKQERFGKTPYQSPIYALSSFVSYGLFIPFALIGIFFAFKRFPFETIFFLTLIVSVTLSLAMVNHGIRHRIILMPLFYLFSTFGIIDLYQTLRQWLFKADKLGSEA